MEKRFIESLSAKTRYQRLMFTQREATDSFVDSMLKLDYSSTMALAAVEKSIAGESIVGVARYAAGIKAHEVEFAIVVADPWQKRGVGVQLLRSLFNYARVHKFQWARGVTFADNVAMVALAKRLGMNVLVDPDDSAVRNISFNLQSL